MRVETRRMEGSRARQQRVRILARGFTTVDSYELKPKRTAGSNRYFIILVKPSFEIPGSVAFDFGVFYFGKVGQVPKVTIITLFFFEPFVRAVSRASSPSND